MKKYHRRLPTLSQCICGGFTLPISPKFRSVLDLLRLDPAGKERPDRHFVFGDAIGQKVGSAKKAWETTVLKAHGVTPTWTSKGGLSAESRAALRAIDLNFHDLRHEAGSRFLEAGWPLHHIQKMLGHTDAKEKISSCPTPFTIHVSRWRNVDPRAS